MTPRIKPGFVCCFQPNCSSGCLVRFIRASARSVTIAMIFDRPIQRPSPEEMMCLNNCQPKAEELACLSVILLTWLTGFSLLFFVFLGEEGSRIAKRAGGGDSKVGEAVKSTEGY